MALFLLLRFFAVGRGTLALVAFALTFGRFGAGVGVARIGVASGVTGGLSLLRWLLRHDE